MKYQFKSITPTCNRLSTDQMAVSGRFFASAEMLPSEETTSKIESAARDKRLFRHIAALSEAHAKPTIALPSGCVAASENHILPQLVDTAPNCGMRIILTDLKDSDLLPDKIKFIFSELKKSIPAKKYIGTTLDRGSFFDVLRFGCAPLVEKNHSSVKNEIEHTFENANFYGKDIPSKDDIRDAIPDLFLELGRRRLGILGATKSHFIYLVKVAQIINPELANKHNISEGQYAFFMHTGSGVIGQYVSRLYTPKNSISPLQNIILKSGELFNQSRKKEVFRDIRKSVKDYRNKDEFLAYQDGSPEQDLFHVAHNALGNYGFANRTIIAYNLSRTLNAVFRRTVGLELFYDAPHVFIRREEHFGKKVWVHRNGTTRALENEPVMIAPFNNSFGCIGFGAGQNQETFFSANHEIGKVSDIPPVKLKGYAEKVVDEMEANNIMRLAAKLEPIAMLTY